jgi:hypothetical protein
MHGCGLRIGEALAVILRCRTNKGRPQLPRGFPAGGGKGGVAALQGGDVPGDDAARFLGAHGFVRSSVLSRTRARMQ